MQLNEKLVILLDYKLRYYRQEIIKSMSAKDKAALYDILREDEMLKDYLLSDEALNEEIEHRDKAFAEGKIKLATRAQLSQRLKNRREAIGNFKYSFVDDEIEAVIVYYESISHALSLRFVKEVENAFDKLEMSADYYFNLEDGKHKRIILKDCHTLLFIV